MKRGPSAKGKKSVVQEKIFLAKKRETSDPREKGGSD